MQKEEKNKLKNKQVSHNGFGIISVILIIIITSIVSGIATGVILTNNYKEISFTSIDLSEDEDLQNFISLYQTILVKYYDEVDKSAMLKSAENGMIQFLGDKYTKFLSNNEYNSIVDSLASDYEGIGVTINKNIIKGISSSSPAEKSGLKIGDEIITVNNTNVEKWSSSEISTMIKTDDNKTISIVIKRNGKLENFTIKKSNLEYPYAEARLIDGTTIGYLNITAFSKNLAKQAEKELNDLEKNNMTGLIVDLRNNGGGYLNSATDTASLFLEKGKNIFSLKSTSGEKNVIDKTDVNRDYSVVVLVNNQTASAAEILAAALKESYNATLVGTQTFGKGKVQQISSLSNGETVKYTTAKWLTPKGSYIDGIGLSVDYDVQLSYKYNDKNEVIGFVDTQLNKGIELLQ